jgi:hypothetical protein
MLVSSLDYYSTLKTGATHSSETPVNFQRATRRYIPGERTFLEHLSTDRRITLKYIRKKEVVGVDRINLPQDTFQW